MTLTGGYDLVIQVSDSALTAVCRRLHAVNRLRHRHVRLVGADMYEFVMGAPTIETSPPLADGKSRVVAHVRAIVRERPAQSPADLGRGAVSDMTLRARLDPSATPGNPISATDVLRIDWSETSTSDVSVATTDAAFAAAVRDVIVRMIHDDAESAAPLGLLVPAGTRAAVPFAVPRTAGATFAVGLDLIGGAGLAANVDHVLRYDWSVALRSEYIVLQLLEALRSTFGGQLPPPSGSAPVVLSDEEVCLLETPFGCLGTGRQRTSLSRLAITTAPGALHIEGTVVIDTDGVLAVDTTANWNCAVSLSIDPSGVVRAQISPVAVQLGGALQTAVNALLGGRLEQSIRDGVRSALETGLSGPGPLEFLDGLLGSLADTGASTRLRATEIDVRADGVVLHGVVDGAAFVDAPVAAVTILADARNPQELVLGTGSSWAPGGDIETIAYHPGDGSITNLTGADVRLATRHRYQQSAGYTVTLTVTDRAGRTAQVNQAVEVGVLRLRLVSRDTSGVAGVWEVCAMPGGTIAVIAEVRASGTVMAGVAVTLSGAGWQDSAVTDASGRASFDVDVNRVTRSPAPGGAAPGFSLGGIDLVASAQGWVGASGRIWLVDCGARMLLRESARKIRDRWFERLAGYAALARLREELGRTPGLGGPSTTLPHPPETVVPGTIPGLSLGRLWRRDPRLADGAALGASIDLLERLTAVLTVSPGDPLAAQLLGVSSTSEPEVLLKRLNEVWAHVDVRAQQFEGSYGVPRGGKPGPPK